MRYITVIAAFVTTIVNAQFDPAGGEQGSKSILPDDESIVGWATDVEINRGYRQIDSPALGRAEAGEEANALGPRDGKIVSLGDGGVAVLKFNQPIQNGEGYDFAVFENGFQVGLSYFLELAHVEVSEDGVNYTRFPSESLTDTSYQINNFSYLNPVHIHNLAGKHQAPYGTLFDLDELGLDQVTHIRLIDVVGSVDTLGSRDSEGRVINDPWPSPFESAGFDLDAVAVVDGAMLSVSENHIKDVSVYPSLASVNQPININVPKDAKIAVWNATGKLVLANVKNEFSLDQSGIYIVQIRHYGQVWNRKIIVR